MPLWLVLLLFPNFGLLAKPKLLCKMFTEKMTLFRSVLAVPAYLDGKEIPEVICTVAFTIWYHIQNAFLH